MEKNRKKQDVERERYVNELINEVTADFEARRNKRKTLDRQWELNMNFLNGNQYCYLSNSGEIMPTDKEFFWQKNMVFNHIAPIMETRSAKFSRVTPKVSVRPASDDDVDVASASLAERLIAESFKRNGFTEVVKKVTAWSETCGTGFYKIVWNNMGGELVGDVDGKNVYEGDVKIVPVSPYEVFPDNLYCDDVENCKSIIHAQILDVETIKEKYGVSLVGEEYDVYSFSKQNELKEKKTESTLVNSQIVIEKYEMPSKEYPLGRLITVCGGKLLYYGDLPYYYGNDNKRFLPFVMQKSVVLPGNFFGTSIIERLIPVQRAFNAVKNRKQEFMNRLTSGILTVEDGSVDVEDLSTDGLSPGKVLVYRQGAKVPEMMANGTIPPDFDEEENKLLAEFVQISGVSDVSSSNENARLSSGSALSLLVDQDNERMTIVADNIRNCFLGVSKKVLHLYCQFLSGIKLIKYQDNSNKTKIGYIDKSVCRNDDVYLESENELIYTPSQKKEMILKLYNSGLLNAEDGNLHPATKEKVLSLLGYNDLDYQKGLSRLHEEKAQSENMTIRKNGLQVEEIDNHKIHVDEHVRYILSEYAELTEEEKTRLFSHVKEHKEKLNKLEESVSK